MKISTLCPCMKSKLNIEETIKKEPTLSVVVKISTELTNTISQRVALLVVVTVIVVPFLAYIPQDNSLEAFMSLIKGEMKHFYCNMTTLNHIIHKFETFYHHKDLKLYSITAQSPFYNCSGTLDFDSNLMVNTTQMTIENNYPHNKIRIDNLEKHYYDYKYNGNKYLLSVTMDATIPNQWAALYGILLMILVIGVLFGFSASFHSSIETLVIQPLQKLMSTLRKSAQLMIESLKSLEKEKKEEQKLKRQDSIASSKNGQSVTQSETGDDELETAMLENLVDKLSTIVKHILPTNNDIVDIKNANVDKTTAD